MLSERAALHVVVTQNQAKSSSPRSAGVDPMYAVLASADLAVVLAVSLGAVLVAIAVIVGLVFVASKRRRTHQFQRRMKQQNSTDIGRPGSAFNRSNASHPGIVLNDGPAVHANGGQHYLLQRATSSASGRQLNVAFAPDVSIELEVSSSHTSTITSLKCQCAAEYNIKFMLFAVFVVLLTACCCYLIYT